MSEQQGGLPSAAEAHRAPVAGQASATNSTPTCGGLQVIGAGFGRTGTLSARKALEQLLGQPVYHMFEVSTQQQVGLWVGAFDHGWAASRSAVLQELAGYGAAIDLPTHLLYRELMAEFPDAKVLLTVRDSFDAWYASMCTTVYAARATIVKHLTVETGNEKHARVSDAYFGPRGLFQARFEDKDFVRQVYEAWHDEVKRVVPPDRLLVFNVKEGWAPLCAFLGLPVPEGQAFPNVNDAGKFTQHVADLVAADSTSMQERAGEPAQ